MRTASLAMVFHRSVEDKIKDDISKKPLQFSSERHGLHAYSWQTFKPVMLLIFKYKLIVRLI